MSGRFFFTAMLLICLLSQTACSFNPFRKDNQLSGSLTGTAVGAGVGAGSAIWLQAPKPIVGLAGIIGGGVGYYVTSLRYAAGGIIRAGGVAYEVGDFATIAVPVDSLFEPNSDEFLYGTAPLLDSIYAVVNRYPENNLMISGNSSGFGAARFEQRLSESRARRIAGYLWSKGISGFQGTRLKLRRLIYVGYGNYFPIANDIKMKGIRANSRIQITLFPSKNLIKDKRYKLFRNVGDLNEPPLETPPSPVDYNKIFPPGPPPGQALHERTFSLGGSVPQSYNRIHSSPQLASPGCER